MSDGPASNFAEFRKSIEERYAKLSNRLQRVAQQVLNEPSDLAFETLAVVAQRCDVQPSSIVRFAQAFGFDRASQMQKMLREKLLRDNEALGYAERVRQFGHSVQDGVDSPRRHCQTNQYLVRWHQMTALQPMCAGRRGGTF